MPKEKKCTFNMIVKVKRTSTFPEGREQRKCAHPYSVRYYTQNNMAKKEEKQHAQCKGRNKSLFF